MPAPLRVGAVSYLNAKPLYHRLTEFAPEVVLEMDVPSRLADRLAAGSLDVALIPSVEYLRGASLGHEILPGFAIAAHGPVMSVKLFSRVPFRSIKRLALDAGSRTSQALTRVWLDAAHGVRPSSIESLPMGVPIEESTADAVLLIGDRAMTVSHEPYFAVVDLAEAWNELTGLPFVFALWTVRKGVDLGDLPDVLERCRTEGLRSAQDIAEANGPRLGVAVSTCYDYLTDILSYDLGALEIEALRRFAEMTARLGLTPKGVDLVFHRRRDFATNR